MRIEVADAASLPLGHESVDLIVTDPPYGISYRSNAQGVDRRHRNATNETRVVREPFFDSIQGDSGIPREWIIEAYRVLRDGSALYAFCHWKRWADLLSLATHAGFRPKGMIVLNKSNHGMGDLQGGYAPKHELLLFATKGRHLMNFPNGRDRDVWDVPVRFSGARRRHPNEKPTSWMERAILNSSRPGQVVLDQFCGSGSTLACAAEHGREAIGFDIDPQWVAVSRERLS